MKKTFVTAALLPVILLVFALAAGCSQARTAQGPVTITFGTTAGTTADKVAAMIWYEKLLKDCNVNINWVNLETETFNLALASGELPDIVHLQTRDALANIIQSGIALDLEPYQKQYLPNTMLPSYAPTVDFVKQFAGGPDKKFYILSNMVSPGSVGDETTWGTNLRWDYYKEIGAPPIKNDDDLIAVLKRMQAAHPVSKSGKKTYGFGIRRDLRYIGGYRAAFTNAVRQTPWTFTTARFEASIVTNTLYDGWTDVTNSSFYADMKFYNKLYREGLLDPDVFTMSTSDYEAKVADGAYMGLYYIDNRMYNEEVKTNPQSLAYYVSVPCEASVYSGNKMFPFGNNLSSYAFVPRNSKNKEKAMEVLNWFWDFDNLRVVSMGQKGVHWNVDAGGKGSFTPLALDLMTNNPAEWRKLTGEAPVTGYNANAVHPDGGLIDFRYDLGTIAQTMNYPLRDFCQYYGFSYPAEGLMKLVDEGKIVDFRNDISQLIGGMVEPNIPVELTRILTSCNEISNRALPLLVGAANDAEFTQVQQKLIADVKAAGEQTVWEWIQNEYNSRKTIIEPLARQAQAALMRK